MQLTARGLTTLALPFGDRRFEIAFDFLDHCAIVRTSDGGVRALALRARPVAEFYRELFAALEALEIRVVINDKPVEILTEAVPFHQDSMHARYDCDAAWRCWRILMASAFVLQEFRARFVGKSSPVHFFWGSFDLAVSRFSGRRAPLPDDADAIMREAYSHEVSSAGFWPGDVRYPHPAYYSYMVPRPEGFERAPVRPAQAFWHEQLQEYLLPFDAVAESSDPRAMLLEFCQSTYDAGAELAGWDRAALEREEPRPEIARPVEPQQPSP
jgi:hypothetical protein